MLGGLNKVACLCVLYSTSMRWLLHVCNNVEPLEMRNVVDSIKGGL